MVTVCQTSKLYMSYTVYTVQKQLKSIKKKYIYIYIVSKTYYINSQANNATSDLLHK